MSAPGGPQRGAPRGAVGGGRRCPGCGTVLAADNTARLCSRCHREQRDDRRTPPAHKSEFFETAEFRAAFESQDIGRVFKVYRNHPHHLRLFGKALNQELLGRWLGLNQGQVSKLENGKAEEHNHKILGHYAEVLHLPQHLLWFDLPGQSRLKSPSDATGSLTVARSPISGNEDLHESLTDALAPVLLSDAGVDDWEQHALGLGRATRYRPASSLVPDLTSDIGQLHKVLMRSNSPDLSRRLARVVAQLSGLMSLTLLKLDDRVGSRNWVRTARRLAAETGDPGLQSWVHAQEAYFHFYDKNLIGAIESAQHAEFLSKNAPCVGSVLATALEARANALLGRKDQALLASNKAESYLEHLDSSLTESSAFGYDEAQLRFHQGNALTQLGSTKAALAVQDRALELYSAENYLDRALVQLDRAQCYVHDGEGSSAVELATATFLALEPSQAQGMIAIRVRDMLKLLPLDAQSKPAALELKEAIEGIEKE